MTLRLGGAANINETNVGGAAKTQYFTQVHKASADNLRKSVGCPSYLS